MQGAPVVLLRLGRLWLDTTHSLALSAREEEAMWSTIPTITFESIDARSRWWDGGVGEDGEGGRWGCVDGVVLVGWQRLVGLVELVELVGLVGLVGYLTLCSEAGTRHVRGRAEGGGPLQ